MRAREKEEEVQYVSLLMRGFMLLESVYSYVIVGHQVRLHLTMTQSKLIEHQNNSIYSLYYSYKSPNDIVNGSSSVSHRRNIQNLLVVIEILMTMVFFLRLRRFVPDSGVGRNRRWFRHS